VCGGGVFFRGNEQSASSQLKHVMERIDNEVRGEKMVYKRGLVELTKEERESKFCKALIEGKIITNYVFPRTKYVCGGCGEVSDCRRDWCLTRFCWCV